MHQPIYTSIYNMYQPIYMKTFTTYVCMNQPVPKRALTKGLRVGKIGLNKTCS